MAMVSEMKVKVNLRNDNALEVKIVCGRKLTELAEDVMPKTIMVSLLLLVVAGCGIKKSQSKNELEPKVQYETRLGIGTHSECERAKKIQGSNSQYRWTKAEIGDLQKMVISTTTKTIDFFEARANSFLEGASPYRYELEGKFFFKTPSKSLKFAFYNQPMGVIGNDLANKEYVVGVLTYNDNSGYEAIFLCPKI
jgi:hypothetical protein